MITKKYWNATDHSVTVDADGRQVDGGSHNTLEVTGEVQRAVEAGFLLEQGEELDTGDGSDASGSADETLSQKASTKKSATQTKEN